MLFAGRALNLNLGAKGGPGAGGPYPSAVRVLGGGPLSSPFIAQVSHHGLLAAFMAGQDQVCFSHEIQKRASIPFPKSTYVVA